MKTFLTASALILLTVFSSKNAGSKIRFLKWMPYGPSYLQDLIETALPLARVIYSRPSKKATSRFGELVPCDQQTGANEVTELTPLCTDVNYGKKLY
jgi:hypothetical protein